MPVHAAGEHGDGAGLQRALMRGGVDAAGEARHDDEAGPAQAHRQLPGESAPAAADATRAPTIATAWP